MEMWMKIEDLCKYLQVPENWIRSQIRRNTIPFHNSHGILRFNRQEIDDWMKIPSPHVAIHSGSVEVEDEGRGSRMNRNEQMVSDLYMYRGKPIKEYILTATTILTGHSSWMRIPDFINKTVHKTKELNRPYLFREEFKPFLQNYYDYLRVSYQLGLIDKEGSIDHDQRRKSYNPNKYAEQIAACNDIECTKAIIGDCILDIVNACKETIPDERHAIFLLWFFLKIKGSGRKPQEYDFIKETDKPDNSFPRIRLNFAASLCHFIFGSDSYKELEFLTKWEQRM